MDSRFEISHHKNKHQFSVFVRMYTWKGFSTLTTVLYMYVQYNKYFDTLSAQYIIIPSICIISIYEPNQHAFALVRQFQLPIIKPITITTTFSSKVYDSHIDKVDLARLRVSMFSSAYSCGFC